MNRERDLIIMKRRQRLFRTLCGFVIPLGRYRHRQCMGFNWPSGRICNQIEKRRRTKQQRQTPIDTD